MHVYILISDVDILFFRISTLHLRIQCYYFEFLLFVLVVRIFSFYLLKINRTKRKQK